MEKIRINNLALSSEKISSYLKKIKTNDYCFKFINENNIDDFIIEKNLLIFNHVINDRALCVNCKGLKECKKNIKGFTKILEKNGNQILEALLPCEYLNSRNKIIKNYLIRDFEDNSLNYKLSSEDIDEFRESIAKVMGRIINGKEQKGMYLFGKTGVGKSYLSICLANKFVELGHSVAYVNARNSIARLRDYVINDKAKFEDFIDKMKNAELLVIDDLGNEKITDWSRDSILYEVLDYRMRNHKNKIIINSNYSINDLKSLYNVDNDVRTKRFINLLISLCDEYELIGLNRFL